MNSVSKIRLTAAELLFNGSLLYVLSGFYAGSLRLFWSEGTFFVSGILWKALAAPLALFLLFNSSLRARMTFLPSGASRIPQLQVWPEIFPAGVALVVISDYMSRHFVFIATHYHLITPAFVIILGAAVLAACKLLRSGGRPIVVNVLFSPAALISMQILIGAAFLRYMDGRLLMSDDHPSFMYRLQLLSSMFPKIPFYNPEWNAGVEARDFFSTGALNVFFLSWPILKLWGPVSSLEDARVYTFIVAYLFIFLLPWCSFAASRLLHPSNVRATMAGIFALGPALCFFEWLLKYGTMGFAVSVCLAPLAVILLIRVLITDRRPGPALIAAALICCSLCTLWSLSALVFIPAAAAFFLGFRQTFSTQRRMQVIAFCLILLLINAPWAVTFIREANVIGFLSRSTLPGSSVSSFSSNEGAHQLTDTGVAPLPVPPSPGVWLLHKLAAGCHRVHEMIQSVNPAIYFLLFPGLLGLRDKRMRWVISGTLIWLLFAAVVGDAIKPQLDLRRMVVFAIALAAVISAGAFEELLASEEASAAPAVSMRGRSRRMLSYFVAAPALAMLMVTPINTQAVYRNYSDHQFAVSSKRLSNFVQAIRQHGGDGRTFFLGFVLHNLESSSSEGRDGGHLAILSKLTGKQLYSWHFMHAAWSKVEPIPEEFRVRGDEGIEEFLDLVNATAVATPHASWRSYCLTNPRYRLVYQDDRFSLFERTPSSGGFFLEGSGEITRVDDDRLEVIPQSEVITLKYRYQPELRILPNSSAKIEPVHAFTEDTGGDHKREVDFIRLTVAPDLISRRAKLTIGYYPG